MATDPGVDLIHRYAAMVSSGDLGNLEALFAPDFVNHRPTGSETGVEKQRAFTEAVRRAVPDIQMTVEVAFADDAFADGGRVAALVTQRGTSAQLGRRVEFREVHLYRVVDGKFAERWFAVDRANFPMVVRNA